MADNLEIRVHAMFHLHSQDSDPTASDRWDWIHILTFPVQLLDKMRFAQSPYKWIRYATGTVIGAQGVLSTMADSPDQAIPNSDLPSTSMDLYYHMTDAERARMYPVDPLTETATSHDSSTVPCPHSQFSIGIKERDETCVLTGVPTVEAAHLLRYSKGDRYIGQYTRHRSRDPAGNDVVTEIDSLRNGILLHPTARVNFGRHFAFLVTPNFALTSADVNPRSQSPETILCTAHVFEPGGEKYWVDRSIPAGSPVRMPTEDSGRRADWPPDILFDAVYGRAVMFNFGTPGLSKACEEWQSEHRPEGKQEGEASKKKRKNQHDRERRECAQCLAGHGSEDDDIDLLMIPYMFMPRESVNALFREAEEKRRQTEQKQLKEKVSDWARGVTDVDGASDV